MDTFLTCTMVFLMLLASFNLFVGVSNDAVNFLSSALGSKSARYNIVMDVAAAGVLLGCTFSSGMMEIARSIRKTIVHVRNVSIVDGYLYKKTKGF